MTSNYCNTSTKHNSGTAQRKYSGLGLFESPTIHFDVERSLHLLHDNSYFTAILVLQASILGVSDIANVGTSYPRSQALCFLLL